jgi:hypothetical protein
VPAYGFAVLTNSATPPSGWTAPTATTANASAILTNANSTGPTLYVVKGLDQAFGADLVLLRPQVAAANLPSSFAMMANSNGTIAWYYSPADSYDFTGLSPQTTAPPANTNCYEWIYYRDSQAADAWHCVYPGAFDPSRGDSGMDPRFLGTNQPVVVTTQGASPTSPDVLVSLGAAHAQGSGYSYTDPAGKLHPAVAYDSVPIQLNNCDFGGPNKLNSSNKNQFPFGQFPRNGDIMQVPYIGSYVVYDSTNTNLLEINPIPLDSAYAAVTGTYAAGNTSDQSAALANYGGVNSPGQDIGRFAPMPGSADYVASVETSTTGPYSWAFKLFDYLTLQSPQDDFIPNTDPVQYASSSGPGVIPQGTANVKSTITNAQTANPGSLTEESSPVDGQVNVNTAPWRVLSALPFSDLQDGGVTNAGVAQNIVNYRDGYWSFANGANVGPGGGGGMGAYQSIFDLNKAQAGVNANSYSATSMPGGTGLTGVVPFKYIFGQFSQATPYNPTSSNPVNNDGYLTPLLSTWGNYSATPTTTYPLSTPYPHNTYGDFEKQNLAMARISNLITTRSDSFTIYLEVQGWTNPGTSTAKLVVQRRAAFIVDRSGMVPASTSPTITNVPTK